jgi:hypothetical protein
VWCKLSATFYLLLKTMKGPTKVLWFLENPDRMASHFMHRMNDWQSAISQITELLSISHKPKEPWHLPAQAVVHLEVPLHEEHVLCVPDSMPQARQRTSHVGASAKTTSHYLQI